MLCVSQMSDKDLDVLWSWVYCVHRRPTYIEKKADEIRKTKQRIKELEQEGVKENEHEKVKKNQFWSLREFEEFLLLLCQDFTYLWRIIVDMAKRGVNVEEHKDMKVQAWSPRVETVWKELKNVETEKV